CTNETNLPKTTENKPKTKRSVKVVSPDSTTIDAEVDPKSLPYKPRTRVQEPRARVQEDPEVDPISLPYKPRVRVRKDGGAAGSADRPKQKPRKRVPTATQRRAANVRERKRMHYLNGAFEELRKKIPKFAYEKSLSRIETLRLAIGYMRFMEDLLQKPYD